MLTFFFRTSSPALSTSATVRDHPLQLLPCWSPPLATLLYCEALLPLFYVVALFNANLFFTQTTFICANTLQLFGIIPCSCFSTGYALLSNLQYSTVRLFFSAVAFSRLTFYADRFHSRSSSIN